MQSGSDALASLDTLADMREVFHRDLADAAFDSFGNDGFARFMVGVSNMLPFFSEDLPELLFRALAAVGLQTTTQGKIVQSVDVAMTV